MDSQQFSQLIIRISALADGTPVSADDAAALVAATETWPYNTLTPLLYLRHTPADAPESTVKAMRERLALLAPSRRTITYAMHGDEWAKFYPALPQAERARTDDVIDTFLRTYGSCTPEEEQMLEQMIFNPTPDYAELLARQEQEELPAEGDDGGDPQLEKINAFIRSRHPAAAPPAPTPDDTEDDAGETSTPSRPESTDDSLLSESLAKIFIKQGRYERAFEIISGLSLKFPKKSAYFADQLRFLQKLIINQRRQRELDAAAASKNN